MADKVFWSPEQVYNYYQNLKPGQSLVLPANVYCTENFSWNEVLITKRKNFQKPSLEILENLKSSTDVLQEYRKRLGKPIIITSSWRTPKEQMALINLNKTNPELQPAKPSETSLHLEGLAIDFSVVGMAAPEVQRQLNELHAGELEFSNNYTHIALPTFSKGYLERNGLQNKGLYRKLDLSGSQLTPREQQLIIKRISANNWQPVMSTFNAAKSAGVFNNANIRNVNYNRPKNVNSQNGVNASQSSNNNMSNNSNESVGEYNSNNYGETSGSSLMFEVGVEQNEFLDFNGNLIDLDDESYDYEPEDKAGNEALVSGQAAPVNLSSSNSKSSSNKNDDDDGHWITTKQGNHVLIEDERVLIPGYCYGEPMPILDSNTFCCDEDTTLAEPQMFCYGESYPIKDVSQEDFDDKNIYDDDNDNEAEQLGSAFDLEHERMNMKQIDHNNFWVLLNNPISKAGVYPYLGSQISASFEPNKIYYVLRPEEEIGSPETLKSLCLLPIVDDHHMLGIQDGMMPAEEKGVHGVVGEKAFMKDGILYADLKVFSEHLKEQISNGKKELSLGYFCDYDLVPGEYNGQHYDAIQRNLKGNHLALVNHGRMGHDVRVMDANIPLSDSPLDDNWFDMEVVWDFGERFREKDSALEKYMRGE